MLDKTMTYTEKAGLTFEPVSLESYQSQEFYEQEGERIFRRGWLNMCRVEQLPKRGSYLVRDIEICGVSVIIIRGKDDEIRAFHNVCTHRANKLLYDEAGSTSLIRCRYHHWSFADNGRLLGVPDEANFHNFDKRKCGLSAIATEVWEGWVFINLDPEPSVGLLEYLGGMADALANVPYEFTENPVKIEIELQCNWKLAIDAFSEAYHVLAVHKNTIGPTFCSRAAGDNKHAHLQTADFYGPHRMCSMFGLPEYEPEEDALVEKLAYSFIENGQLISSVSPERLKNYYSHPALNPSNSPTWSQDLYLFFPHTSLYFTPGNMVTMRFWPTSLTTTRVEQHLYVPDDATPRLRFQQQLFLARIVDVVSEDTANFEHIQKGVSSGGVKSMMLQDNEVLLRHQMHHVEKWVASNSAAEAMGKVA